MTMDAIDHGFCINLDRRPDRMARFRERLPAPMSGLVERFRAVDGRELSLTPEIQKLFENNDFKFRRNIIGCHLSHYNIWKAIAADEYPYDKTVIFEDDVWFSKKFLELWNDQMAGSLPADFDLIYLGGLLGPATQADMTALMAKHDGHIPTPPEIYIAAQENDWFARPKQTQFCTYSYIVSSEGARKLCSLVERDGFERSVDWFMIDRFVELNVYATTPLLCWAVFAEGSDILLDFDVLDKPKVIDHA